MSIASDTRVGRLAAEHPLATRVFARHGIDYCCGGGRPLSEACEKLGLDVEAVLREITEELESTGSQDSAGPSWDRAPLAALMEHIVEAYHQPLREELPRLEAMARKVARVHGQRDPERLAELLSVYLALQGELEDHMAKEELVLFPMIRRGLGWDADSPISVMEHEHDSAATALRRIRELTDDYRVPEGACNTWRALWHGLAALEGSLHRHIHLENNVLFPRALAG